MVLGNAEPGDHIYFARGAINPFILRPTSIDCSYLETGRQEGFSFFWTFVGIAYVHGMTDRVILKIANGTMQEEHIYLI
jgi:hypothetical protein